MVWGQCGGGGESDGWGGRGGRWLYGWSGKVGICRLKDAARQCSNR